MENTKELEGNFTLKKIEWKEKDFWWHITVSLSFEVDIAYYKYGIRLEYDDSNYLNQIQTLKQNIATQTAENQLFDDIKQQNIVKFEEAILSLENDIAKARIEYPDIEFIGMVGKVNWNFKYPAIILNINDTALAKINEKKQGIHNYKIILTPQE